MNLVSAVLVSVMKIRVMWVFVPYWPMSVQVGMRFNNSCFMGMIVMFVMHMNMVMFLLGMRVFMFMAFGDMQPRSQHHE